MIGRFSRKTTDEKTAEPPGFDAFELRLGDMMRGERATLGKSLLDVERELRIKASYIAAIENCAPDEFDTPGFIAGYVRSYARYLGMDPDNAFQQFCAESGFSTAHGMSDRASVVRKPAIPRNSKVADDFISGAATPFAPVSEGLFASIGPGAIGSALVLFALIAGLGYGGWSILNEVQRVKFAPVENTPDVLADLDPLAATGPVAIDGSDEAGQQSASAGGFAAPQQDRLDRLYRPQALDVPVMVARDAPISTLKPSEVGTLGDYQREISSEDDAVRLALGAASSADAPLPNTPQVLETPKGVVQMVAVRPSWVRVSAADGTVIYEAIMNKGDVFEIPNTEEPATLRTGESGAIYFAMDGQHYGPVGPHGSVTSNLALSKDNLVATYEVAELDEDRDLMEYVAELTAPVQPLSE